MDPAVSANAGLSRAAYAPGTVPDGYSIDAALSNKNRQVYVKDGKATIAFRGTDLSNSRVKWQDLGSDLLLGLGLTGVSSRFKNADRVTKAAIGKYGKDNVSVTGHSLGGSQALAASRKNGVKAVAFNPGAGLSDAVASRNYVASGGIVKRKHASKATIVTTGIDPIGILGVVGPERKVFVKPKSRNVHGLGNFL